MKTIFKPILILSLLFAVAACGGGDTSSPEAKQAELEKLRAERSAIEEKIKTLETELAANQKPGEENVKVRNVSVATLAAQPFQHSIDVQGRIDADESVNITAMAAGTVKKVYLHAGAKVSAGQVIAEIDHDILSAQLGSMKSNLEMATDMYKKQKSLWEQKVGTEMQFNQARTNKESLEKQVNALNEQIDLYNIKAPVSGTVDEVNVKAGQNIAPGMPAARVVNLSGLKIKAEVSESYSSKVKLGAPVRVEFADIGKTINGRIDHSARYINPLTRTFSVEVALPNDEDLRPNMLGIVRIVDQNNPQSIVIPINIIQHADENSYVYIAVKEGNRHVAKKRDIVVGAMYNGKAEILKGLNPGDVLITTGYQDLNENEVLAF